MKPIDAFTMEVKLRKGIKFHDGSPFTAADVKATYEYGSQPDRPAQWYPGLVTVDVVDDYTCHINTKAQGYPATLYYYLSSFLPILSAKDVANKAQLSARMNGTGPYQVRRAEGRHHGTGGECRVFPRCAEDPERRVSFRRRHHDANAFASERRGRHHRAAGTGTGRDHREGFALQHPQGGVGREQVSLLPLFEEAV